VYALLPLIGATAAWAEDPPAAPAAPESAPAPTPAPAPPPTAPSAEDLAAIEAALAADSAPAPAPARGAGGTQSMNPDISFIADVAFAWFSAEEPLMVGGHDPTANGFTLQQLEMAIAAPVDPYFSFHSNLVFSLFGVEIEEVYGTTSALPGRFQVRAGQFLTRYGRINPTHPHSWDFVDQAVPIGRLFGGEGNRGLGLEATWLAPTPWYVELVASETYAGGESTARSFWGAQDPGFASPLDLQTTLALKQFFPLGSDLSLAWGLSGALGPNPTGLGNRTEIYGTDVYLKYRPVSRGGESVVSFQGELMHRRRQVPEDVLADWNGYGQVFWRFARRWGAAARYEFGTAATGLDGTVADDPLDPEWTALRQRISANTTFWPTEFSRLRLQAHTDLAGWREEPDYAALLAVEFNVGAHGAHAF